MLATARSSEVSSLSVHRKGVPATGSAPDARVAAAALTAATLPAEPPSVAPLVLYAVWDTACLTVAAL